MSITRVVAITGCDSGLGWAIAARSAREGLITVAGMYNGTDTKAAEALKKLKAHPCELDVTNSESVSRFRNYVDRLLKENPNYKLHAVVNNAGVMIVGNFEWQTPAMIQNTIDVNLLGAMKITSAFLPDLRKSAAAVCHNTNYSKPRIINVASHCGLQPLPGFGAYSASKAGLIAWTKALRLEHREHGLTALIFVPGGFVSSSNILANQIAHGKSMIENLNAEQRSIYEQQISTLTSYLSSANAHDARFDSLRDENITETFMKALTQDNPQELYKVESWRYMFYYNILKLPLPEIMYQWIIKQFLSFPKLG